MAPRLSSFRGAPTGRRSAPPDDRLRASPESITTKESVDSGPAPQVGNCRPKAHPGMTLQITYAALSHFPERQIDTLPAHQGMLAVRKGCYAVKRQPCRATPHRDVAVLDPKSARPVAALQSAEQEDRGQAQRDRDDRRGEIGLVLVLMQRHTCSRLVAVDQARFRGKPVKTCLRRRLPGERAKRRWHRRPG